MHCPLMILNPSTSDSYSLFFPFSFGVFSPSSVLTFRVGPSNSGVDVKFNRAVST